MSDIEIGAETEGTNCWSYPVTVFDGGKRYTYEASLSWSDYDHWCKGRVPPAKVLEAAFKFLLAREPASAILEKFDCSVIRRYFPEVDEQLPEML